MPNGRKSSKFQVPPGGGRRGDRQAGALRKFNFDESTVVSDGALCSVSPHVDATRAASCAANVGAGQRLLGAELSHDESDGVPATAAPALTPGSKGSPRKKYQNRGRQKIGVEPHSCQLGPRLQAPRLACRSARSPGQVRAPEPPRRVSTRASIQMECENSLHRKTRLPIPVTDCVRSNSVAPERRFSILPSKNYPKMKLIEAARKVEGNTNQLTKATLRGQNGMLKQQPNLSVNLKGGNYGRGRSAFIHLSQFIAIRNVLAGSPST